MISFRRRQLQKLVDKLPEEKLDDAFETMTEIMEETDYDQSYIGELMFNYKYDLHREHLRGIVDVPDRSVPKLRTVKHQLLKQEHNKGEFSVRTNDK